MARIPRTGPPDCPLYEASVARRVGSWLSESVAEASALNIEGGGDRQNPSLDEGHVTSCRVGVPYQPSVFWLQLSPLQLQHCSHSTNFLRKFRLLPLMTTATKDACSIHTSSVPNLIFSCPNFPSLVFTSCLQRHPYKCTSFNSLISIKHAQ